ncbi:MAG: DUF1840 domain-containing protein [Thiohalocapsa sp.]|uniref:DUF1840 domain-containing protein n=1 Tax=Thiohalocapsa sp. TaxID=2497641 RepID=UPI0025DC46C4|nr:DUF1840 domain-containing protein [Thiohalocapsa sp.]MCG6942951.1 DUF1840 domain-containing protein [Thiohalocapsa sp.]
MLITFKTPAYADITMFGDVAKALIKMMGHSGTVPGAILADDVPMALENLRAAVKHNPDAPLNPHRDNDEETPRGEGVSLSHRAMPLLEMLAAAARDGKNVMWDQS